MYHTKRCPPAIYQTYTIWNITNNAELVKYSNKNPKPIFAMRVFKNLLHSFSLLAAIHLFISSHDEIKDFCSMDKKTGRRYGRRIPVSTINIQFYRKIDRKYPNVICEDILMRCAENSIFDCAGVWAGGFAEPSRYVRRLQFSTFYPRYNLREIFDERRLDEIF